MRVLVTSRSLSSLVGVDALEGVLAPSGDPGEHRELQLVQQVVPDQRTNERRAAVDADVAAGLSFELRDSNLRHLVLGNRCFIH